MNIRKNAGFDEELASIIDHTLLKPDATEDQIIKICSEAKEYSFASLHILII